MSDIAIKVENVSKSFKLPHEKHTSVKGALVGLFNSNRSFETHKVLKDISFEVKKGEFFGIVGRNGSGKSTLLKLLAGIYTPDSGHIQVNGKLTPFIELGVGFSPELTGRENVFLNGALLGFNRKEMDAMYDEIVEFAELEKFMDQKLKNYSSGMQVRLAFSIAIRANTEILVLDEVLAVGDEAFQRKCYEYFNTLRQDKKTVILVTHSMDAVKSYCNKAILIEDGKIAQQSNNVNTIANEYSQLFNKTIKHEENKTQNEKHRWGTRELTFNNLHHTLTKKVLTVEFDIKNNTNKNFTEMVDVGIDIYSFGDLVAGTNFLKTNPKGLDINARENKHIKLEIPNNFGKHKYSVDMNIRTEFGRNTCDSIDNAFSFFNMYGDSKFYKIILNSKWSGIEK